MDSLELLKSISDYGSNDGINYDKLKRARDLMLDTEEKIYINNVNKEISPREQLINLFPKAFVRK